MLYASGGCHRATPTLPQQPTSSACSYWSKLPPVNPPGELGHDEDAVASYREALRADPNAVTHQGLGNALSELRRFVATFLNPVPGHGEALTAAEHGEEPGSV